MALLTGWATFVVTVATLACIYGLLTVWLTIRYGYTGLLSFGHVAFFAAGAYTAAILTMPPSGQVAGANYVVGLKLPMTYGFPVSLAGASLVIGLLALLIGPNGVGKSTLFDCITGVHIPEEGAVRLNGEAIDGISRSEVADRGYVLDMGENRFEDDVGTLRNAEQVVTSPSGSDPA